MNKTIITVASFITAIAFGFFLVLPRYDSLKIKISDKEVKEVSLNNKNEYYRKISEISNELKKYSAVLAKIDFALPQEISSPLMYDFFQKKASEAGLVLKDEKLDASATSKDKPAFKEYRFSLELSGSYPAFKNYLTILEKSAKIFEIENISFSSPDKNESIFSFNMSVKFYSY